MRTIDYMTALKSALQVNSDYALAQRLGASQQAVSKWRQGKATIGDDLAPRVAEILSMAPEQVIADLHAEREKNDALRAVWQSISNQFARAAMVLVAFAGFNITVFPGTSEARNLEPAHFLTITARNINSRTLKLAARFSARVNRYFCQYLFGMRLAY